MKIEYSQRAIADTEQIVAYYRKVADRRVANAFDRRLHAVIERIKGNPQGMPAVTNRSSVRVALLSQFPYKVFFGWPAIS